jgi:hypothetical protein
MTNDEIREKLKRAACHWQCSTDSRLAMLIEIITAQQEKIKRLESFFNTESRPVTIGSMLDTYGG